jgi:hypothetical protein
MDEHIIVALVATKGVEDFLLNALTGLTRAGVDPRIIHVARPDNATAEIDPVIVNAGAVLHSFADFNPSSPEALPDGYVDYGTDAFIAINWEKVRYIRWLLDRYRHVVYADLDVGWLADPLWYLQSVAQTFPLAFQTEACRRFPPVLCWGFISAIAAPVTLQLLDTMLSEHDARPTDDPSVDEQSALDAIISRDPTWLRHIHLLSEGLFLNGLGYRNLVQEPASLATMHGRLEPFVFHANWTVGLANKRALMSQTGTWLLGRG